MKFKYAAEICRTYKGSGKCPLSTICKKHIKLSKEDVEEWSEAMETKAKDLLEKGDILNE